MPGKEDGGGRIETRAGDSLLGNPVDIRRADDLSPVTTQGSEVMFIGLDDDQVHGRVLGSCCGKGQQRDGQGEQ